MVRDINPQLCDVSGASSGGESARHRRRVHVGLGIMDGPGVGDECIEQAAYCT
jgi:hypothetical protein